MYPGKSVYNNIASPLRIMGKTAAEIDRAVRATADMLKLTPLLDRKPLELSGGQQQRCASARALVWNAGLVLGGNTATLREGRITQFGSTPQVCRPPAYHGRRLAPTSRIIRSWRNCGGRTSATQCRVTKPRKRRWMPCVERRKSHGPDREVRRQATSVRKCTT